MIDRNLIHWTDDDELVSRFVMHRLPLSEEEELTSHLSTCEKCRQTVKDEEAFVARMKEAGRSEMKERLRTRLQPQMHVSVIHSRSNIPWTRIAGAAAVVIIIIAVGIYNNWLGIGYRPGRTEETAQEPRITRDTTLRNEVKNAPFSPSPEREMRPARPPAMEQSRKLAPGSPERRRDLAKETAPSRGKVESQPIPAGRALQNENIAAQAPQKDEAVTLAGHSAGTQQGLWVEGHIIPQFMAQEGLKKAPPISQMDNFSPESDGRAKAKADVRDRLRMARQFSRPPISLRQQPSSFLPEGFRREYRAGIVHSLIEPGDSEIQITLFLNPPVTDSTLSAAEILAVGRDSLVIRLPNQSIGLALPPGLLEKVKSNARR